MHLVLLIATLLALCGGPLLYGVTTRRPGLRRLIDRVVLAGVVLLMLAEVLPDIWRNGGIISFAFLAAGMLGPTLAEHALRNAQREAHMAALVLAFIGLIAHSFGDGVALSPAGGAATALPLGIALHSIPVGLAVWWLLAPVFGARVPALALAAMCASTVAGFVAGTDVSEALAPEKLAWLQALIAGTILHVVLGRPHLHGHGKDHDHEDVLPS